MSDKNCDNCKYTYHTCFDKVGDCTSYNKWEPKEKEDVGNKYYDYMFKGLKIDPYRICIIYDIKHPALQHALKKLLRIGRHHKDLSTDLKELRKSLDRYEEMCKE